MGKPFHLSVVVPDLEAAKHFYVDVLGCDIGRDHGQWADVLFFGHQLTMHQENELTSAMAIDHFGPVLGKAEWLEVSRRCGENGAQFAMPPTVQDEGTDTEAGKFIVKDPAGNVLEFKYYASMSGPVVAADT